MLLLGTIIAACAVGSIVYSDKSLGAVSATRYVFGAWWFMALCLAFSVNLILCSWRRSVRVVRALTRPSVFTSADFYEGRDSHGSLAWSGGIQPVVDTLRGTHTSVYVSGNAATAQRGAVGRLGATIVHIGLLLIVASGFMRFAAARCGWGIYDARMAIPEGASTRTYYTRIDPEKDDLPENLQSHTLPFSLRALDFTAEFHPNTSQPRFFSSLLELSPVGGEAGAGRIYEVTMSRALSYHGYKITQNSYTEDSSIERGRYVVTDTSNGDSTQLDAGDADPVRLRLGGNSDLFFQVNRLGPDTTFQVLDLSHKGMVEQGTVTSADSPTSITTGRYRAAWLGTSPGYVTYLGLTRDPSAPWLFAACIMVGAGAMLAFMVRPRETWAWCDSETSELHLATSGPDSAERLARLVSTLKNLAPAKKL